MNDGSPKKVKKPKTRPALSSDSELEKEVKHEKIPKKKRPSASDGPVKRGKKAQAHRSSSSGSDSEREREVRKPVKKRSSESPRKPVQKEKPKVRPSKVEKPKKKPELASERRVEKKKEPSVEEKLQKLHSDIKFALKVDNPDIKKCLDALEELGSLQVTSHILQKNTDLVATLKKIRRYKANKDVMEKAAEVYTRLKSRVLGPKQETLQKGGKVESDEGQQDSVQNDSQPIDEDGEKGPETKKEMDKVELSAPMNGDSTSQRSESGEDKECEDEQTSVSEKKTSPAALKTALQDDSLLEKVNTDHRDIEEKTAYRESEAINES